MLREATPRPGTRPSGPVSARFRGDSSPLGATSDSRAGDREPLLVP